MKLLGPYKSQLSAFFYEELLGLLKDAIKAGELSGNKTFDTATVQNLVQQAEDFSTLPIPSAGQRVTDDSLNTPLNLLKARLIAISNEVGDFDGKANSLISVIKKDSTLLDQLLSAAYLEYWVDGKLKVLGADKFYWDYGMGYGQSSADISLLDPGNGVTYSSRSLIKTYFDTSTGELRTGLSTAQSVTDIAVKNLQWEYTSTGQIEELYGNDWAQLSLLEKSPILNYANNPLMNVVLPADLRGSNVSDIFSVSGTSLIGSLPVYVKTSFQPRRNSSPVTVISSLSGGSFDSSTGWTLHGWVVPNANNAQSGTNCAKSTDTTALISPSFSVSATQKFYVEGYVKAPSADGTFQVSINYYDDTSTLISSTNLPIISPTVNYEKFFNVIEAPTRSSTATLSFAAVGTTTGNWYLDSIVVHLPITVSNYSISQEEVYGYVLNTKGEVITVYEPDIDFIVNGQEITFLGLAEGTAMSMRFTEYFPAYQCSINEKDWSNLIMFDADRPYPDNTTAYDPILIINNSFPLTDETGTPVGLTIQLLRKPSSDYIIQVYVPTLPDYGSNANLLIQLERAAYVTGLRISPFSTFAAKLVSIEAEDFATNTRQLLWAGGLELDRSIIISFPRRLVRRFILHFYQENYSLKEHVVDGSDSLRRDVLAKLQSALPFSARRVEASAPIYYRGAQYEFGIENIAAEDSKVLLEIA